MTTKKIMVCIDNKNGYEDLLTVGKSYAVHEDGLAYYGFINDSGRSSSAFKSRFKQVATIPAPPSVDPFISKGYSVQPAANGGFVVHREREDRGALHEIAAFSSAADLLVWLTKAHGVAA